MTDKDIVGVVAKILYSEARPKAHQTKKYEHLTYPTRRRYRMAANRVIQYLEGLK